MDAIKLVDEMSEKGFHPDKFTYCTLAAAMLKAGQVRESQHLLVKVLSENNACDAAIWNVYFHNLILDNRMMETRSLLMCIMDEGFIPSTITCNTILKGFCLEKKLDEALNFLQHYEWVIEGPDVVSINTILHVACKEVILQ
ncbi:hypothetical protein HPP92_002704 [Vanilla planifolia]|uniref:Pentatricopeptide repeat-containing protein n=1 Tax=Vanilla planifolia TaxID=51239 RepID=A0A835RWD1_VANPL|nr:hypothetical protein HPP92_002704 [Vanilla planifolia]